MTTSVHLQQINDLFFSHYFVTTMKKNSYNVVNQYKLCSIHYLYVFNFKKRKKENASTGNRTRTARVAGEHSTIEPSMLMRRRKLFNFIDI